MRRGENCKELICLVSQSLCELILNDATLDEHLQPENCFVSFFNNDAQLCHEFGS